MRTLTAAALSLAISGTQAMASTGGAESGGIGFLGMFFIAFGILIVLFQFLPGAALFAAMMKGIFASEEESRKAAQEARRNSL